MVLSFLFRPTPSKNFYKKGSKILLAFLLPYSLHAQSYCSHRQIALDDNDELIELTLNISVSGDSLYLWREDQPRQAYAITHSRRRRSVKTYKFEQGWLKMSFDKNRDADGAFMELNNKMYFLYFKRWEML